MQEAKKEEVLEEVLEDLENELVDRNMFLEILEMINLFISLNGTRLYL